MKSVQNKFFTVILSSLFFSILSASLLAWPGANGISISTAVNIQTHSSLVSTDSSSAIITWQDLRNGSDNDIYAQRVNSAGSTLWTLDGLTLCNSASDQLDPTIASDGAGGAIITWWDFRNGSNNDIYAQRVNSNGSTLWSTNGVPMCTAVEDQSHPQIISDGAGGAMMVWYDARNGIDFNIYAQRVNSNGTTLWGQNGVAICTAANSQYSQLIISDGAGGAIITWQDFRTGTSDIYAQRVNSNGSTLWTLDGVAICTSGGNQYYPTLVNDGSNGAIITWEDIRSNNDYDIYSQRVNSAGSTLWILNGVAISTVFNSNQQYPTLVNDGSNGAIITWEDLRSGNYDIYAQRVNSNGSTLWTPDGVTVCTAFSSQYTPLIVSDGTNGAIITWTDFRNGNYDVYAQRVDSNGSGIWTPNGVPVTTAVNDQNFLNVVSDGAGGAIMSWTDNRLVDSDIFAKSIDNNGTTPIGSWELYASPEGKE